MITQRQRRAAFTALAVSLVLATAGCGGTDDGSSSAAASTTAAGASPTTTASASFNEADVMFAQMMIPHHEAAVEMADLAEGRAEDPEVKQLAEQIKAAQQPEIEAMTGWLQQWDRPVAMPDGDDMGHEMPGAMSEADMKELSAASGAAFDKQFLTMMIAHHEGAIEMAEEQLADGEHPDAKTMAQAIMTSQQAEIATMEKILARL